MNTVSINNETVETVSVTTSVKGIGFTVANMSIQDAVVKFCNATELSVADGETVCGIYKGLTFESATVDASGNVTVKFHIKDEIEARIDELEEKCAALEAENAEMKQTQAEQDELLAEILFGTTEETEQVEDILEEEGEEINE